MTKTLSICALLLLAGCNASIETPYEPANRTGKIQDTSAGVVEVIALSDGTRCAVYDGYNAGGIHCDWQRPGVER